MRVLYLLELFVGLTMTPSPARVDERAQHGRPRTATDSAEVIRAAWGAVSAGHRGLRAVVFWSPSASDTGQSFRIGEAMTARLTRLSVPMFFAPVVGDDTVHIRLIRWSRDATSEVLEFRSSWSTVIRNRSSACRTGSVNFGRIRVSATNGSWIAEAFGPVVHGDRECVPIPPS